MSGKGYGGLIKGEPRARPDRSCGQISRAVRKKSCLVSSDQVRLALAPPPRSDWHPAPAAMMRHGIDARRPSADGIRSAPAARRRTGSPSPSWSTTSSRSKKEARSTVRTLASGACVLPVTGGRAGSNPSHGRRGRWISSSSGAMSRRRGQDSGESSRMLTSKTVTPRPFTCLRHPSLRSRIRVASGAS